MPSLALYDACITHCFADQTDQVLFPLRLLILADDGEWLGACFISHDPRPDAGLG